MCPAPRLWIARTITSIICRQYHMNKRQIGNTGIFVNEIGYGSMSLSLNREARLSESEAITLLRRMVDELGIEFIDTADAYAHDDTETGHGERLIAKALAGERRQHVTIATKGGFIRPGGRWTPDGRPEHLRAACEASLSALGTDRIDLYQFHTPDPAVPLEDSLGALADMQREGKIRHIGVSNLNRSQLETALGVAEIVSLQNPLSFVFYDDNRESLLRFCEEKGITWIAYAPLGGHRNAARMYEYAEWVAEHLPSLDGKLYTAALAWLLQLSPAVISIPATTQFDHLAANMEAASLTLTDQEMELLPKAQSCDELFSQAMERGEYDRAAGFMKRVIAMEPRHAIAWYCLACSHAQAGKKEQALEAWSTAVAHGFADAAHAQHDTDLDPIRSEPTFQQVLERIS